MDDFEHINETGGDLADYLKCKHCGERVERGIANVKYHWEHCLIRTQGLIIAPNEFECQILDRLSINI